MSNWTMRQTMETTMILLSPGDPEWNPWWNEAEGQPFFTDNMLGFRAECPW